MTTTTDLPPPAAPPPPSPPRRLLRSSGDRYVAGVAGGLGRYTGLDPVIFRVVLAVLAVFGGAGLVLYLAAWLMLPEDNGRPPGIDRLLRRPSGDRRSAGTVVVGIIAACLLVAIIADGDDHVLATLLVLGGIGYLVVRQGLPVGGPGGWQPPGAAPTGWPPPADAPTTAPSDAPVGPGAEPATGTGGATEAQPASAPAAAWSTAAWPPPPRDWTPPPPRPRSFLTPLTLSTLLIVTGVAVALDRADVLAVSATGLLATLLLITGAALLVATRYGRARGLLPVGIVLAVATAASTVGDLRIDDGVGSRSWEPTSVSELRSEYRHGVGELQLDLTQLDDLEGTRRVAVRLGVGQIRVFVPEDVDLEISGDVEAGELRFLDEQADGRRTELRTVRDVAGDDKLILDLEATLGEIEVRHAAS